MRIIISIRINEPEAKALQYVQKVMNMGKISGNNDTYCYITTFNDGTVVSSRKTKTGHRFVVAREAAKE